MIAPAITRGFGPGADLASETYGVTGVALITFILLAHDPLMKFSSSCGFHYALVMVILRPLLLHSTRSRMLVRDRDRMNFEAPLTTLVWLTLRWCRLIDYVVSSPMIHDIGGDSTLW